MRQGMWCGDWWSVNEPVKNRKCHQITPTLWRQVTYIYFPWPAGCTKTKLFAWRERLQSDVAKLSIELRIWKQTGLWIFTDPSKRRKKSRNYFVSVNPDQVQIPCKLSHISPEQNSFFMTKCPFPNIKKGNQISFKETKSNTDNWWITFFSTRHLVSFPWNDSWTRYIYYILYIYIYMELPCFSVELNKMPLACESFCSRKGFEQLL